MSYQPQPPMGGQPPVQGGQQYTPPGATPYGMAPGGPPSQQSAAPMTQSAAPASGKGLLYGGLGLIAAGLITGIAMYALSGGTEEETVKKFARAPVGCTTTLEFDKRASFTLYVETKGTLGDVGGDCEESGSYERGDDDRPQVVLTMVDANDQEVELSAVAAPRYDVGSYRGRAVQQVSITEPGTYRLTVASEDTGFAIAIGGAPDADSSSMQSNGLIAGIVGLVLGGLLLLLWNRKKGAGAQPAMAAQAPYQPAGGQPWQGGASVPGAVPTVPGYQPQQPTYQQPPQQPQYQPQQPTYQQQPQQPQYQPQQPTYQQPPQQPAPQPPAAPPDQGWGAPQQ